MATQRDDQDPKKKKGPETPPVEPVESVEDSNFFTDEPQPLEGAEQLDLLAEEPVEIPAEEVASPKPSGTEDVLAEDIVDFTEGPVTPPAEPVAPVADHDLFADHAEPVEVVEEVDLLAEEPAEAPAALPPPQKAETDSVLDEDMVDFSPVVDPAQVSGVFSSASHSRLLADAEDAGLSDVIRGEHLSESVPIEPLSDVAHAKSDSEIQPVEIAPAFAAEEDVVELVDDSVFDAEFVPPESGDVALPESAVKEEAILDEDVIGAEHIVDVSDSDVALESIPEKRTPAEKEPVLDLDEALAGVDSPAPSKKNAEQTLAFQGARTDEDIDITDLVDAEVDLGQEPARKAGTSGIDPLAEALESGVHLDEDDKAAPAAAAGVEFDDLVTEEDDGAAVDIGGEDAAKPAKGKASARLPRPAPVASAEEDIDIDHLLDDVPSAPADESKIADELLAGEPSEEPAEVIDEIADIEEPAEPTPTPAKKGKPTSTTTPASLSEPYEEPKPRSSWGGILTGTLLGVLLVGGAAGGVWYAAPELIPESPNAPRKAVEPIVAKTTPLQLAQESISEGKFDEAIKALEGTPDTNKAQLTARGQAHWLKHLEKQSAANAPLNKDDDDVKKALDDFRKAENAVYARQVTAVLESATLKNDLDQQKKIADSLKDEVTKAAALKTEADNMLAGITKTLVEAKQLDGKDKLDLAIFQKTIQELALTKASLAQINKTLADAKIEGGVDTLVAAKKDLDDKLGAVNKLLEGEKVKEGAKGLQEVLTARDQIAKDRESLDQTVKAAVQELAEGKLIPAGADPRKGLVEGARAARIKSESPLGGPLSSLAGAFGNMSLGVGDVVKNAYDEAALIAEVNFFRAREMLIPTPEQQLGRFVSLLQNREETNARTLGEAIKVAEFVLSPQAKATEASKAKALYVQGMVRRNELKFPEAKVALTQAVAALKDSTEPWAAQARRSLAELTDPSVYYLPRIDRIQAESGLAAALKEADAALAALGNDPQLLARRSLLSLEANRAQANPKSIASARSDAEAALQHPKTAAAGAFALGQIEEATGKFDVAEQLYRKALKAGDVSEAQAAAYRLALGRLLLRDRNAPLAPAAAPAPAPAPAVEPEAKEEKKALKVEDKNDAKKELKDDAEKKIEKNAPDLDAKKKLQVEDKADAKADEKKDDKIDLKKDAKADDKQDANVDAKKKLDADLKKNDEEKKEPQEKKVDPKAGQQIPAGIGPKLGALHPLSEFAVILAIGQAPTVDDEDDPATQARIKESIDLANTLIKSKDPKIQAQGYLLLGEALTRQGQRTEGLKQYGKGLEMLTPNAQVRKLLDEHPAFQVPDSLGRANPLLAEKHYGIGLHLFHARKFAEAETQFRQATGYFDKDARYFYFLGLSQIEQRSKIKRDMAYYNWEKASQLEANSRPRSEEVNFALERVQGDRRTLVNSYRSKTLLAP